MKTYRPMSMPELAVVLSIAWCVLMVIGLVIRMATE